MKFVKHLFVDEYDILIEDRKARLLKMEDLNSDEAGKLIAELDQLYSLKAEGSPEKKESWLGKNAVGLLQVASGILGMGMVLGFEKTDVITSKAFNWAQRMMGK